MPAAGALQRRWFDAVRIHLDANEVDVQRRSGGLKPGIGQRLGENAVARHGQSEQQTEQRRLRAGRNNETISGDAGNEKLQPIGGRVALSPRCRRAAGS